MEKLYAKADLPDLIPDCTDDILKQLEIYHSLLLKWNRAINIVSPNTLKSAWHRHIADSAQIAKFIPAEAKIYADLGCGGGFPGLIVAMIKPDLETHLVESDERKCQFMRTVAREAGVENITIHTKRIEETYDDITPDIITARALASLKTLCDLCLPWAEKNENLQFCFMKGAKADQEIKQARARFEFDLQTHKSLTSKDAQIITMKNLKKIPQPSGKE